MTPPADTVLIAHRAEQVRERFAATISSAGHVCVTAGTLAQLRAAASPSLSLALIDCRLSPDDAAMIRELRRAAGRQLAIVAFAGTIPSAASAAALAGQGIGYLNEHAATSEILPALGPHLFPERYNRRTSARVPIGVPLSYRSGETIAGAVTLDIGRGGLTVRTIAPLEKGAALQVRFRLPGSPTEIDVAAHVVWSDARVGMGVRFDALTPEQQWAIDTLVDK
jgi:uncharacterized protein (TIGR02266 family)